MNPTDSERAALLDELDEQFYAYPDDVSSLVERFLTEKAD